MKDKHISAYIVNNITSEEKNKKRKRNKIFKTFIEKAAKKKTTN
jgi:hypothetical protein